MNKIEVWPICREVATKQSLDPYLIMAIIEQESNYDQFARRLEQGFFRRYTEPGNMDEVSEVLLAVSWGLMQTMGESLRALGFFGDDAAVNSTVASMALSRYLADPKEQIQCGCEWYKKKLALAGGNIRFALLKWNGGGNPMYPDEVFRRETRLRKEFPQ
jgi:soluble lytic murein transglycosylase-like protein